MPYLDLSKIALPKDESDFNTWADYFELLCLLESDRNLSVESIKDRLVDECGGDEGTALSQIIKVKKALSTTSDIDRIGEDQIDSDDNDPEIDQKIRSAIIIAISYLKSRRSSIPIYYPFSVDVHHNITANVTLSNANKIYVILLLSSLIKVISVRDGYAYRLTHRFEELCEYPFKVLIPSASEIYFFGAGGYITDSGNQPIAGSFFNKVSDLASRLKLSLSPIFTQKEAGAYNNGDGGLDWIAYMPFKDGLSSMPTFFAQCACGNDWEDKQFDAHKDKWRSFIHFINDTKNYHFIPKSFRDNANHWKKETSIMNVVLIDRFRLLELIHIAQKENEIVELYADILEELEGTVIDSN